MDLSDLPEEVPETPSSQASSQALTRMHGTALSYKQHCQIQALRFLAGWTYLQIAETTEVPLSTVWDICQTPATPVKPKVKRTVTTPIRKRLISEAMRNAINHRKSYRDIAVSIGLKASNNTLRRVFEKEGYHRHSAQKKPLLSQNQKDKRLEFAQSVALWDI